MIITRGKVLLPKLEVERDIIKRLERAARVCYKSEDKIKKEPNENFIKSLLRHGHESVLEHEKISLMMVTDRGITHEVVRHRVGSYSQESTRYCNYSNDKFGNEITVIEPFFYKGRKEYEIWEKACLEAEKNYFELLEMGSTPQEARSVLPNSLKTEIVVTYNIREWRHFLRLRCAKGAHPQVKEIAIPLLMKFIGLFPALFEDIEYDVDFREEDYADIVWTDEYFVPLEEIE